jgi:hypothetical protein
MMSPPSVPIEQMRRNRIAAISSAVQRRPIVLVLGMHRSGTSLCSHILSALGVDIADDIGVNRGNEKGHWERWEIVEFHDRILRLFNRDYFGSFHDFALPVAWWADPRVAQIRREIVTFLERRMGEGYFGFKDPRTVRLMPVWHQIFNELKLAPRIVLCLRNPAQIGRSLHARDGLDPAIGEYRWLVHMIDFFRYTSKYDLCVIEYEEWFSNPSQNIEKLQKFLDLPWQQSDADLALALTSIVEPAARHDDSDHREPSRPMVRTLYKLTRSARQDGVRDQIASIVSQFITFQQLQGPFVEAFEESAKIVAKYSEIEGEAAVLRSAASERDAVVQDANARAAGAESRLAEALLEIDEQRAQIAELAREREEASGLKATLAEREAALAERSRRADEFGLALQAAQVQLATNEAALQRAEQERTAAAEAVRETQRQAEEAHLRMVEALQGDIAVLRERIAAAEREMQERATTATALRTEVVALQGALAAARQVGKALSGACRIEAAAPTKPYEPSRWLQVAIRFLGARNAAS